MIEDQLAHIKHQNQTDPEMLDVAQFEKDQLKLAEQEAKGL